MALNSVRQGRPGGQGARRPATLPPPTARRTCRRGLHAPRPSALLRPPCCCTALTVATLPPCRAPPPSPPSISWIINRCFFFASCAQNATTIASKFRDLYGLELALKQELRELGRAQVGGAAAVVVAWQGWRWLGSARGFPVLGGARAKALLLRARWQAAQATALCRSGNLQFMHRWLAVALSLVNRMHGCRRRRWRSSSGCRARAKRRPRAWWSWLLPAAGPRARARVCVCAQAVLSLWAAEGGPRIAGWWLLAEHCGRNLGKAVSRPCPACCLCGRRCRAETAVAGRVCRHCKLEERFWQWEASPAAASLLNFLGHCPPLLTGGAPLGSTAKGTFLLRCPP